jgi:hypothetical protein
VKTFLELCQDVASESGAVGAAPTSVIGQTGRQLKCVNWVARAWRDIQRARPNWTFLRADWSGALTATQPTYTGASFAITRFGRFLGDRPEYCPTTLYDAAIGQSDENAIRQITYDQWKRIYDRGSQTPARPTQYCIAPDGSIRFGPIPDAAYAVRGEMQKSVQDLANNDDVPDLPSDFHDLIVWKAIMIMAGDDEAVTALADARTKFSEGYRALIKACVPEVEHWDALA